MKQKFYAVAHVKFQVNWFSNTIRIPRFQKVLKFITSFAMFQKTSKQTKSKRFKFLHFLFNIRVLLKSVHFYHSNFKLM